MRVRVSVRVREREMEGESECVGEGERGERVKETVKVMTPICRGNGVVAAWMIVFKADKFGCYGRDSRDYVDPPGSNESWRRDTLLRWRLCGRCLGRRLWEGLLVMEAVVQGVMTLSP